MGSNLLKYTTPETANPPLSYLLSPQNNKINHDYQIYKGKNKKINQKSIGFRCFFGFHFPLSGFCRHRRGNFRIIHDFRQGKANLVTGHAEVANPVLFPIESVFAG